ncbi:hypothetical protein ABGB07_44915 [Micromonosporaceae bacterium B7E4]
MNLSDAGRTTADWVEQHPTTTVLVAGAVMVVLALLGRWIHRQRGKNLAGRTFDSAAVLVAVALSAEGMWEAATEQLDLRPEMAVLLFAFAELAMLRAARRARAKVDDRKRPGVYGLMVWGIALGAGLIATSNAPNTTEHLIRFGAPLLVAAQWWADLVDDLRAKLGDNRQESDWIWTPTRLMIRWGWKKPGAADDLTEVLRDRNVAKLVDAAMAVHATRPAKGVEQDSKTADRAAKHARRLQALAKTADRTTVAAARDQIRIALGIQRELLADVDRPAEPVDDQTRAALDEIRLSARETSRRLRAELPPADQFWANNVVRIPTHLMDQIRTNPVDQPVVQGSDQNVDQVSDHSAVQPVVQKLDQKPDQPEQVDQQVKARTTRRSGLVLDDSIPPRIQAMAKALAKRFKGEIPARRTVMERMGWTSTGDAQTAINLVRAQRAEQTNDPDRAAV